MRRKRFYLACFSLLLVLLALGDLTFQRGWASLVAELFAAAFLAWDAWRNHRAYVTKGRPEERVYYPRAEAVIFLSVGAFLTACVGLIAYVVANSQGTTTTSQTALFAALAAVILAMAGYAYLEAWRALRKRSSSRSA